MEFQEATIKIIVDLNAGPEWKETPGKIAPGTGLGYWLDEGNGEDVLSMYVLTHLSSGHRFPCPFFTDEKCIQQTIERIAPLINWDRPFIELVTDPGYPHATCEASNIFMEVFLQGIGGLTV